MNFYLFLFLRNLIFNIFSFFSEEIHHTIDHMLNLKFNNKNWLPLKKYPKKKKKKKKLDMF